METLWVTAPIKHGKTTFAELVSEIYPDSFNIETSEIITEVADAFHEKMPIPPLENDIEWMNKWLTFLPPILKDIVHVDTTYGQLKFTQTDVEENFKQYEKFFLHSANLTKNPDLANHKITIENKDSYRPILQSLGSLLIYKVSGDIWSNEIAQRLNKAKELGAPIAIVGGLRYKNDELAARKYGGHIVDIFRPGMPEIDINDPTERERSSIQADIKINNDGTIDEFRKLTMNLLDDVQVGQPKSLYIASDL